MKKPSSVCTLVRKTLGVPGRTAHSGRGFYEMEFNDDFDLLAAVEAAIVVWTNRKLVESVTRGVNYGAPTIRVSFIKTTTVDGYYRHLAVSSRENIAYVGM